MANYIDDLKILGELRNHIVHDRRDPAQDYFAIPNDHAIQRLETIWTKLSAPPVLGFDPRPVKQYLITDTIGSVVYEMSRNIYSQVPVYTKDVFFALLTTNTIALWLGACCTVGLADLRETTIDKVLEYQEYKNNYLIKSRKTPVAEAVDAFRQVREQGRILDAILITENGRKNEKPIGIFTVSDLPRLFDLVKN